MPENLINNIFCFILQNQSFDVDPIVLMKGIKNIACNIAEFELSWSSCCIDERDENLLLNIIIAHIKYVT